jgi:hypothetical protein
MKRSFIPPGGFFGIWRVRCNNLPLRKKPYIIVRHISEDRVIVMRLIS